MASRVGPAGVSGRAVSGEGEGADAGHSPGDPSTAADKVAHVLFELREDAADHEHEDEVNAESDLFDGHI